MSRHYLPHGQKYRITLELDVMDDFNPHNIDWEKVLDVQGGETVDAMWRIYLYQTVSSPDIIGSDK